MDYKDGNKKALSVLRASTSFCRESKQTNFTNEPFDTFCRLGVKEIEKSECKRQTTHYIAPIVPSVDSFL